jgi:excisionase family DNA binding protein
MSIAQERDAYPIEEARQRLGGIARQTIYDLINQGELASITIGTRRLIPAESIRAFVQKRSSVVARPAT